MFNAEQLLGQILGGSLGGALGGGGRGKRQKSGMSMGTKAQLGIGLLGVAYAAYEHYNQKQSAPAGAAAPMPSAPPPPPPSSAQFSSPPPPPAGSDARQAHALLLIRAMIAAAAADGAIDAQERATIIDKASSAGLHGADLQDLETELANPLTLYKLIAATPAELRSEVYAASVLAITADDADEHQYLGNLSDALGLDQNQRDAIHQQLTV